MRLAMGWNGDVVYTCSKQQHCSETATFRPDNRSEKCRAFCVLHRPKLWKKTWKLSTFPTREQKKVNQTNKQSALMREKDSEVETEKGVVKTREVSRKDRGRGGEVEGCDYRVTALAALSWFPGNYKARWSLETWNVSMHTATHASQLLAWCKGFSIVLTRTHTPASHCWPYNRLAPTQNISC